MSIFLSSPWLCTFNGTFKEQWIVIVVWVTPIFMGFQFISHNMEVGIA